MKRNNCALIYNKNSVEGSDNYIPTLNRNIMVHELLSACHLLEKMELISPTLATFDDLAIFHASDYLTFLKDEDQNVDDEFLAEFGFGYDCPLKSGVYKYCTVIAGGSITAADLLCKSKHSVVFHWLGGWHHAKRSEAAGYCYVNDCVLAILRLREVYPRVLYVDLDVHHGDGVQDAFCATDKVMTFSVHKFEPGFFPGTGSIDEIGYGKGKYYSVNLPLLDGIQDDGFVATCQLLLSCIKEKFKPNAVVIQVGADGLNGDPMRSFNLTSLSLEKCVKQVVSWDLPTLVLGGGGYNEANVAKCWAKVTASILDEKLPEEIPEHKFFPEYGPDFEFAITKSLKKDMNSKEYLDNAAQTILSNLSKLN